MLANKVNTRLLIRTIVRDFLLSAKSSFIMCQALWKEGLRWNTDKTAARRNIGVESKDLHEGKALCTRGNLCMKHLQQLLLIVGRPHAYKCYYPLAFSPHEQYRVWQVCSIIKAQTRLRQETLMPFACEARTLTGHLLAFPEPWGYTEINLAISKVQKVHVDKNGKNNILCLKSFVYK